MEQIQTEHWAILHFGLIFIITCAQMLVVYALTDANNPTRGLGLYTVYFMAALLGWIAFTLQQWADVPMALDVPSVAAVINNYILFLAAGERARIRTGRVTLGVVCLGASLCVFFVTQQYMFGVRTATAAFFFACAGLLCAWRCWREQNVGDGLIAVGALVMVVGGAISLYYWQAHSDLPSAHTIAFGAYSVSFVLVVIGFLASVLVEYQQRLSNLATEDPLTRLLNRRGLNGALQVSLALAARQGTPTAAIALDIDGFKEVNHNFGHETGDQVIRQVALYLERMSRSSDVVARSGGEEFILILPNTDMDGARLLAERIREAIAERPLLADNQRIPVTICLGVAGVVGEVDLDQLVADAERALHLAKQAGRNRVASVENRPVFLTSSASSA